MLPPTEQAPQLLELLEEVPPLNRLMLGWLTVHMAHVAGQVGVGGCVGVGGYVGVFVCVCVHVWESV